MKTVALIVYAETKEEVLAECRRQMDLISPEEYEFEMFVNPDLDAAWRAAGERDFYIWLHGLVTPVDGALYRLLDNSSFLADRALLVGTVQDGEGRIVSGGFGRNRRLLQPDPVIPVACRMFDGLFALVPRVVYDRIGVLGGRYRGQLAGFDYAMRARKAGYPSVIAPGICCTCPERPNPGRTLASDFLLDLRTKGPFTAIWYFLRSAIRRFVIHNLSVYE
jgi:GT2 family glycosyltransferase